MVGKCSKKIPQIGKVIKVALCIFSALIVESNFSEINHIVNDRRSSLTKLTVSAVQTTRYVIRTAGDPAKFSLLDDMQSHLR